MLPPFAPDIARKTWRTLEPVHGLVYFAAEPAAHYADLGVTGRAAYFASRAAAMGAVRPEVVIATFFNFRPSLVFDALPRAWEAAPPEAWIAARVDGADAALRRVLGDDVVESDDMRRAADLIAPAAAAVADDAAGRPLAAAHAGTPRPDTPHLALWHSITALREHRGDGHVACLVGAEVDACEALVLHAATGDVARAVLQATRAWTDDEWSAAVARLASRGWVDRAGAFTDEGRARREAIERRTDELAVGPWSVVGEDACDRLRQLVRPWSKAIVAAGTFARPPQ
jgi:hypothetical protein